MQVISSVPSKGISPNTGVIAAGAGVTVDIFLTSGLITPFGSGATTSGGTVAGDSLVVSGAALGITSGYILNSSFSGSLSFENTSFAALGIDEFDPRTFVSGNNTVVLSSSISAVPAPAGLALILTALSGLALFSRKRHSA